MGANRHGVVLRSWLAGLFFSAGLVGLVAGCGKPNVSDTPPAVVEVIGTPAQDKTTDLSLPGRGEIGIEGRVNGPKFEVELARTEAERSQGLMFRRRLDEGRGMLFFMPGDQAWQFWMRNTYLRLDMVFIDADWRVVGVLANVPPLTEDRRAVAAPSRYILELAGHDAARHGIVAGTPLQFRELPSAGTADAAR